MSGLLSLSQETLLNILAYLDLPDLAAVGEALPSLAGLTVDPVLHTQRLTIVAPARLQHFLFSRDVLLRPTFGDLVQRGVIRGLNIEQRWRMGQYFYNINSVKQYEFGRRLARKHAGIIVSRQLDRRPSAAPHKALEQLHHSNVLPDVELSSTNISRNLLPVLHKLKWSLHRDRIARILNSRIRQLSSS